MGPMFGQMVAGWVRAGMPALAGLLGLTYGTAQDTAIATIVTWLVAGLWSMAQKKGWVKF